MCDNAELSCFEQDVGCDLWQGLQIWSREQGCFLFFYSQKSEERELGNWETISIGPYRHTVPSWWDDELKKLGEILTQSRSWKLWPFPTVQAIKKRQLLGIKRGKKTSFFLKFILKDIKREEICNYVFIYGHQILKTFHLLWDALNASSVLTYLCPNNVTIKVFYNPY